jgi:hypothetical protein
MERAVTPDIKKPRETAEARFERVRIVATRVTEDKLAAVRKNMLHLKALREEKEAAERQAVPATRVRTPGRKRS